MDKAHFLSQLSQALGKPAHFDYPDALRPGLVSVAEAIDQLPIEGHAKGGLYFSVLQTAEYIRSHTCSYMPVAAPAPVPPEPAASLTDPTLTQAELDAEAAHSESLAGAATGETGEQSSEPPAE